MISFRQVRVVGSAACVCAAAGCAAPKVDFAKIKQPSRAAELDVYNVFVGKWKWEAEMLNAEGPDRTWTGTAEWTWALDNRYLHGNMEAKSANAKFTAEGIWSWHPTKKRYLWWMFNNWGYPQEGSASYDATRKLWTMDFVSVGLDGTKSYGRYRMTVVDADTLTWTLDEWADMVHSIAKVRMTGTYKRQK